MTWAAVAAAAVDRHGALQKPGELADLLALLAPRHPGLVLEVGADAGGTLWAWAQLGAAVIAVTLPNGPFGTGRPLTPHGAHVITGDSHHPGTRAEVAQALAGRRADLLFIDGDHTYEGASADVADYAGFVAPGGLVALHDICPGHRKPVVQVHRVWSELAAQCVGEWWELVCEPVWWGGIGVVTAAGTDRARHVGL